MKFILWGLIVHLILTSLNSFTSGVLVGKSWCSAYKWVRKTRIQWQLQNSKYVTYTEYFTDLERVSVCCDGYQKISDTECKAICEPACPSNSKCVRPGICECTNGYLGYSSEPLTIKCQLACFPRCPENSSCSVGNLCVCNDGYTKNSSGICEPACRDKCPDNSTCIKPNICHCNMGYSYNNKSATCEPQCSITCPEEALCSAPETCVCSEGYELGKTEDNTLVCVAKCGDDCPDNSFCKSPNFCECDSGYKKSFFGNCEPVCESACPEHSSCTAPNNCSCGKGYEMIDNLCQPMCNNSCPDHGHCVQPNKCECLDGYQLKFSASYNIYCEPQCQQKCSTFGKCIQPNKCECLKGYKMDEMEICMPVCSKGCTNGLCFRPDVCICKPGYLMGPNDQCEPVCSMPCQNATCIEPEICQCSTGYTMKKGSVSICEPQCKPECINGVCIDANVCICHDDHVPVETENGGFDHSNCLRIKTTADSSTTTTTETYITLEDTTFSVAVDSSTGTEESTEFTKQIITDINVIPQSTTDTPLVNSNVCTERCQCWEEYDMLGPLSTGPQCVHSCLDAYDEPCLNFSLCQCDNSTTQLHCHSGDEEDGDSDENDHLLYTCRILKQKEFIKDIKDIHKSKTIEIRNTGYNKDSSGSGNLWMILGSIIGACFITSLAVMVYIKCRKYEDPIMEYEM